MVTRARKTVCWKDNLDTADGGCREKRDKGSAGERINSSEVQRALCRFGLTMAHMEERFESIEMIFEFVSLEE